MANKDLLNNISLLSLIAPLIGILISYLLGLYGQVNTRKIASLKERYLTLYVPYLRMLLITPSELILPSELSFESRGRYLDLLTQNAHLLGSRSSLLYPKFYSSFLDMLELESGENNDSNISASYDDAFIRLEDAMLVEASKLSKKLKYPNLSKTISTIRDRRLNE